jgi:chitinase
MWIRNLLERFARQAGSPPWAPAKPRPRTYSPTIESLEDRLTPAAMLSIGDVNVFEGNDGAQNALITVRLTEPHGNNVTVNYNTVDGSAVAGSDYTAVSGKLTFTKNEMSKSIVVSIKGDRLVESDEYFNIQLSNAKGAKIADGMGYVSIIDNEPRVYVSYAYATEVNEGTSPAVFTVFLTAPYDQPVTINYATADGSALAGADYAAAAGSVTFMPGQTSQDIPILVLGDRLGEPTETFALNVSTPDSFARMGNDVAYATITDNEPQIFIADAYNYGESTMTFTVTLSVPYDQKVTVDFATVDDTAIAGVDYVAASGTLVFDEFQTSMTITVGVLDPSSAPDKYFHIHLTGATTNALLATESAYGYWYYDYAYGVGDSGYWDGYW